MRPDGVTGSISVARYAVDPVLELPVAALEGRLIAQSAMPSARPGEILSDPTLRRINLTGGDALACSPLATAVLDSRHRIVLWNQAAEELFGWPVGDVVGTGWPGLSEAQARELDRAIEAALAGDAIRRRVTHWPASDGRDLEVALTIAPLAEGPASAWSVVVYAQDVDRSRTPKRREEAIRRLASTVAGKPSGDEIAAAIVRESPAIAGAREARLSYRDGAGSVRIVGPGELGDVAVQIGRQEPEASAGAFGPAQPGPPIRWLDGGSHGRLGEGTAHTLRLGLTANEQRIGTLDLTFDAASVLDEDAAAVLDDLAGIAARALAAAQPTPRSEGNGLDGFGGAERTAALTALTTDLATAITFSDVARVVLERGLPAMGATLGALALLDSRSEQLIILGRRDSSGFEPDEPESGKALEREAAAGSRPLAEVARSGEPVFLQSGAARRERYPMLDRTSTEAAAEAMAVVPLSIRDRVIGSLCIGYDVDHEFSPEEKAFAERLAERCAQAIERSRLFEAERNARLTLDTVIRQMPIGVVVAEPPRGHVVFANDEVGRIWRIAGRRVEDLRVEDWTGYTRDGRRLDASEWPLVRSIMEGVSVSGEEVEIVRGDGSRGSLLVGSAPVRDTNGAIIAAVTTFSDVSDRRDAEAMRDAFVSVISHELRTPITAIYGGVQVLRRPASRLDPAIREEVIEDVAAETERLNRLVEDLLVLARAERGVPVTAEDPILLGHLLPRVIEAEQPRWPTTRFQLALPLGLPTAVGDEGYLEQVFRNLLSNAAKYGPVDGLVDVVADVGEGEVLVRVLDEGPGVDESEVDRLFELFYRSARTSRAAGAGIGLFVTRNLVQSMGGRVWARNRPDRRGAEFGIALRLFEEPDAS